MATTFTAGQYALMPASAISSTSAAGPYSMMVILKRSANSPAANTYALTLQTSADAIAASWGFNGTDFLRYNSATGSRVATTLKVTTTDGWVAIAMSKATGAAIPRFHKYVYSTGVASHEDATSSLPDFNLPGTTGRIYVARFTTATDQGVVGSYALGAIFNHELSDAEFESCTQSLAAIKSSNPTHSLILFDGATLIDIVGGGPQTSNTGTADAVDIPLSYGNPITSGI